MLDRVVAIAAAIAIALIVVLQLGVPSNHEVRQQSELNLRGTAMQANVAAQRTPNPSCNPVPGAAKMGSCAPVQAFGAVGTIAKAAGDPEHVKGKIGVDVSSYQGCAINWTAQKRRGVSFAFFKATEGLSYTDGCLRHNVASAKKARLPYGVYDFLRPQPGRSPASEAAHFVAAVHGAGANTSLPPVADVEANAGLSPTAVNRYVCAWHRYVRKALGRKTTITYTGNWFWTPQVGGSNCGTQLWISAYASNYLTPSSWRAQGATVWQYSDGVYGPTPRIGRWDTNVWLAGAAHLASSAGRPSPIAKLSKGEHKIANRRCYHYRLRHRAKPGSAAYKTQLRHSRTWKHNAHLDKLHLVAAHAHHPWAYHAIGTRRTLMAHTERFNRTDRRAICQ
jgi:lysozyme